MAAVLRVMSVAHPTLGAIGRARRPNARAGRPRPLNLPDWLRAALAGRGKPIPFGSLALRNHLAVREILRTDSGLREQYAATKRRAGATAASIDEYGRGKNAGIQQILAAAGLTDAERAAINANQVPPHDEIPR
jgi:hypothetical protein